MIRSRQHVVFQRAASNAVTTGRDFAAQDQRGLWHRFCRPPMCRIAQPNVVMSYPFKANGRLQFPQHCSEETRFPRCFHLDNQSVQLLSSGRNRASAGLEALVLYGPDRSRPGVHLPLPGGLLIYMAGPRAARSSNQFNKRRWAARLLSETGQGTLRPHNVDDTRRWGILV